MSRRFGRQQKRKLLERLSQAEKKQETLAREITLIRNMSRRNREAVENTARVLGEYFCALAPKTVELKSLQHLGNEWRRRQNSWPAEELAEPFVSEVVRRIDSLPVMKCRAFLDDIRAAVHYRFTFNGKEAGYAISQSTIMQQPGFKEAVRRNVSEAVARMFMDAEVQK